MFFPRFGGAFGLCALVAFVAGCSEKPSIGQVEGTVTYQGKPLPFGTITFVPEKGRGASGRIENGKILDVSCYEPNDGAPVGTVKVGITSVKTTPDSFTIPPQSLIPEGYGNPEKSNLKADIQPGMNQLKFDLK